MQSSDSLFITNSIFHQNTLGDFVFEDYLWIVFKHNLLSAHPLAGLEIDTAGNLTGDPLFASAEDTLFLLSPSSPAIDQGAAEARVPLGCRDIAGQPRVLGEAVDIGPYER